MDENDRIPLGGNIITINNENLEEAEELEDRKRREEEMHKLLTHAMGDFNFDESTLNSSMVSVEGDEGVLPCQRQTYDEQYREANSDDQLKLLYEVRVREVLALNTEVERLTTEYKKQEQILKNKATLLEIENERKNISLKEAQELLIDRTQELKNINEHLENTQATVKKLEANVSELNQETLILRESNMKLDQQLALMERGFPLYQQTADKELREKQRNKITQLENSLEMITDQMEQKERQHKELIKELKNSLQEKEYSLAEKSAFINKITENLEHAQERCIQLSSTVEELRQTQKTTQPSVSPLEEELRKIREYKERTDVLCENVRKVVSEEFQGQIAGLNSENRELKDLLQAQKNELLETKQQLKLMSSIEAERDKLETLLKEFQNKYEDANNARATLTDDLIDCQRKRDSLRRICDQLSTDNDSFMNIKEENKNLQQQILDLQLYINEVMNPTTEEKCIQTESTVDLNVDLEKVVKENDAITEQVRCSADTISRLQEEIQLLLQENAQLKERESLIKKLQNKAAQFEKIIFEKQKKVTEVECASKGTNTEDTEENPSVSENPSLLKIKYDALLYQSETEIRKKLKQEFDDKLKKLEGQQNKKLICENCDELRNDHKKLRELRIQDREAVIKLVNNLAEKFSIMEKESEETSTKLKAFHEQQLVSYAVKLQQEYVDKCKEMSEQLKAKTVQAVEHQKEQLIKYNVQTHSLLNDRLNKIISKTQEDDEEIAAIEERCMANIATFQRDKYS